MRPFLFLFVIMFSLGLATAASAAQADPGDATVKPWSVELRVKNYLNSHTSYEFGNPFPPGHAPLSRLEFPMNALWAGVEARRNFPRFSLGIEIMRNVSTEAQGIFKDSDWTDEESPKVRTIYSESNCRLDPSYSIRGDLDLKVSDWLRLPGWFDLRPVVGFRWQRVAFVTHDGMQYDFEEDPPVIDSLPGDGIRFDQTYWHYFIGLKTGIDLEKALNMPRLKLQCQVDLAYVEGSNQDHHLLRAGNRFTYERTTGDAWHVSLGITYGLTRHLHAGVAVDYLKIVTAGSHRLVNRDMSVDLSWCNGVKVRSEQTNVMLSLEYMF